MLKTQITFTMTVDKQAYTTTFKDTRCLVPICYRESASPETIAETYRAAAAYFLELAHQFDTVESFRPCVYSESERIMQFAKLCHEKPIGY